MIKIINETKNRTDKEILECVLAIYEQEGDKISKRTGDFAVFDGCHIKNNISKDYSEFTAF